MNRFEIQAETLQENTLTQSTETVTRTARLDISGSGVDEIDPPEDLDEYWEQYKSTGIVRSNINQFISDVVEPGVRIEGDDDTTVNYFMGGDDEPEFAPEGGFLKNCAVYAGETHQPFHPFLKSTIANKWVRGTILIEQLKADSEDSESEIHGFYHVIPESVYPQVHQHKNILLDPDPDAPGNEDVDFELTPRGEVAAYIQFDDNSILGRRTGFSFDDDQEEIRLSQNDVMKQVLDPDIGGSSTNEQGIFGTSILESISTDVEEYNQIKRDRHTAIQNKAYGIWLVNFLKDSVDLGGDQVEIVEWEDQGQSDVLNSMDNLGPGDYISADGPIDLEKFEGDVPDLDDTLKHYVDDITAPLPAPKYSVGFEKDINQFVTERQETRYEDLIEEERQYQQRKWTSVFKEVAERHENLDPSGLKVKIEPEEEESPVLSLETQTINNLKTYMEALDLAAGPTQGPGVLVEDDTLRTLLAQLPEDSAETEEAGIDESDAEVQGQFASQFGNE